MIYAPRDPVLLADATASEIADELNTRPVHFALIVDGADENGEDAIESFSDNQQGLCYTLIGALERLKHHLLTAAEPEDEGD